jgi:hypothetical protein
LDLMKKENIFPTVSRDQYYSSVFFHKRTWEAMGRAK